MNSSGKSLIQDSVEESAPIRSIAQYLNHPGRRLVIPPWQREYVWQVGDTGEVGELLQDLKEFIEEGSDSYLIGSIITCEEPKGSGDFWLIDGQQRSLTFLIFLMACKRFVTNYELKERDNLSHENLSVLYNNCISYSRYDYEPKLTMDRGKADSILQSIHTWSGMSEGDKPNELLEERENWTSTQRNLANVAEWIYEKKFVTESWLKKSEFLFGLSRVLHNVKLIEIQLPDPVEALTVFDRINNRGADLTSSDLIKNRIFQQVDDEEFGEISEEWREMKKNLSASSLTRLREPAFLLRSLALIQVGIEAKGKSENQAAKARKITYQDLTQFWSSRLDKKTSESKGLINLEAGWLIKELNTASEWLSKLSYEHTPDSKKTHFQDLYFSRFLKTVQHYPILLAGKDLDDKVFEELTRQVHARTSYYFLAGERTQDFEKMVPDWTFEIAKLDKDASISDIKVIYDNYKISSDQFVSLKEAVLSWSYRDSSEKKKIRAVLAQLSRYVDQVCEKELRNSPESYFESKKKNSKHGWDIDHVMPHGRAPKDSYLHTIGNLVLLHPKDNSSRKNLSPFEKKANYESCPLFLTKTLVGVKSNPDKRRIDKFLVDLELPTSFDLENWDETQIKSRSEFYFQILENHLNI
jgi:uncharacterized protein with ParB-like and HNH nuclease domain